MTRTRKANIKVTTKKYMCEFSLPSKNYASPAFQNYLSPSEANFWSPIPCVKALQNEPNYTFKTHHNVQLSGSSECTSSVGFEVLIIAK